MYDKRKWNLNQDQIEPHIKTAGLNSFIYFKQLLISLRLVYNDCVSLQWSSLPLFVFLKFWKNFRAVLQTQWAGIFGYEY